MTVSDIKVARIATATAKAEGFFKPGSLPARCHNPGDLEIGDRGQGTDDGKTIFKDDTEGWMRLRFEWQLILNGLSGAGYKLTDTFTAVAVRWTGDDGAAGWAQTVAGDLGLSVTNTLQDYLNKP